MMIIKFIKTHPIVTIFFIICAFFTLLINYHFYIIPTFFGKAAETNKIVYDLSIGYIISSIFYYFVVFIREEKDKSLINLRVVKQSNLIILEGYTIFSHVFKKEEKTTFPPSIEVLNKACKEINFYVSPLSTQNNIYMSWEQLINYHKNNIVDSIDKLKSLPHLESVLFGILTEIEDSKFFALTGRNQRIYGKPEPNKKMEATFMAEPLFEYFNLIQRIETFIDNNYKEFKTELLSKNEVKKRYLINYKN